MNTGFDVLEFLSPSKTPNTNEATFHFLVDPTRMVAEATADIKSDDEAADEESSIHVHALDLPHLSNKPPADVLLPILRLMKPMATTNFSSTDAEVISLEDLLKSKSVSVDEISEIASWLQQKQGSVLTTTARIANISLNIPDINQYLTTVISSPLSWISDDATKEIIWREASLRLAANCGRTAAPEFVRNIKLDESTSVVRLNEPSLTADNLGLKTWGSSLVLSKRLVSSKDKRLEEPILELGAGTGLVGITCRLLGYEDVVLTDLPEIVPNLKKNLELNNIEADVEVLDWSNPESFEQVNGAKKYMTIILSDPIYSSEHPHWIVNVLDKFLDPNGTVVLQVPIRINFGKERDLLWKLMAEKFAETDCELQTGFDDFGEQQFIFKTFVYSSPSCSSVSNI